MQPLHILNNYSTNLLMLGLMVLCYALAGALRATCAKTEYCQVNYDLVDKVLGVRSIDIAQYSKAPG